jgi:hypothetical protein
MDWGSLIGATLLLTLSIVILRALWCWLLALLVLGPPAYGGIVVGHLVGAQTHSVGLGLLTVVVLVGLLTSAPRAALRGIR